LDALLCIYGNGTCVGYFVFLGDFIPSLIHLAAPNAPDWCSSRIVGIFVGLLVVLPMALQRELAALRHLTPVSILALAYVAVVIFVRCFYYYNEHKDDHKDYGELKVFDFDLGLFNAFSICVFAYNCHINVVPVAGRLIRPTKERIQKVAWWVNGLQLSFYSIIGVAGYLTFLKKTKQDIIHGFPVNDPFMAVGRVLLSFTMVVAIPLNTHPAVRSAIQIRDYFFPDSPVLLPSPRSSPRSSPQSSPVLGSSRQAAPAPPSPSSLGSQGRTSEPALPRIVVTVICLMVQVLIAIAVPGVADVLSLLGATVASAMIMLIPAYAIGKVLPRTLGNRCQQAVLILFACVSFASVPVKVLQMAKVVST